jgi:hypothetical protein
VSRLGSPPPGKPACYHLDCEFHECRYTGAAPCPYCGHDLAHHDQPDCWDCTNSGTRCDSEPDPACGVYRCPEPAVGVGGVYSYCASHGPEQPCDPDCTHRDWPHEGQAECCDDGPAGHTRQEHHDASACFDRDCTFDHPHGGPFLHPCDGPEKAERSPMPDALREPVGTRYQDKDGWNGPQSVATTQAARDTVSRLYVIPSNDGGLVLDLHAGGMEVEINVEPDGRISLVMAGPPDPPRTPEKADREVKP